MVNSCRKESRSITPTLAASDTDKTNGSPITIVKQGEVDRVFADGGR